MTALAVSSRVRASPVAGLSLVLAALLDLAPLPNASGNASMPAVAVCVLFFWTLARPELLPGWLLLGLGISVDLVSGLPPGPIAMGWLLGRQVALSMRRSLLSQQAVVIWAAFLPCAGAALGIRWAMTSLLFGHLFSLRTLALEVALTLAAYPLTAAVLGRLAPGRRPVRHASRA